MITLNEVHDVIETGLHNSLRQSLDEVLNEPVEGDPLLGESPTPFTCDTLEKAAWAARKLKAVRAKQNEVRKFAGEEVARIEAWERREEAKHDTSAEYFEALLTGYARQVNADDPKQKTITLPDAVVKLRKEPDSYERDEAALLELAHLQGLPYIRVKESLDWAAIKTHLQPTEAGVVLTDTGEVLDGVTFVPGAISCKVEVV